MLSMVEYVHDRVKTYPCMHIGVDMTMGNGHDTIFLSECCDEVYAFDIQKQAIENTKKIIGNNNHVHLILDGHQNIDKYIKSFDVGIFNLGYLPLANHCVTTVLDTTQIAIKKAINMVDKVLFIVVYPGHKEGYEESLWIDDYVKSLDTHLFNVSCFKMMNKKNSPYVIEIEKKGK